MSSRLRWLPLLLLLLLASPAAARAEEPARALFALLIGVNQSVDKDQAPLRYADDDAARYLDLFRALGARTYLLTRADENTRRLHPQAAARGARATSRSRTLGSRPARSSAR